MNNAHSQGKTTSAPIVSLHEKAEDNLKYIRASMEAATAFTGVSGKGYVIAGVSALAAAWLAERQTSPSLWLGVWMAELVFAMTIMLYLTASKASAQGGSLWSSSGKKLLLAFLPAMAVGAVLTLAFFLRGDTSWLPGIWLSLYGAAVMTAGAYSVAVIPTMGALFLLAGSIVLLTNLPGNLVLGLTLGGLHIVFGVIVWRDYGG